MQSNKSIKGRAIVSDEENIRDRSLKLYTYLVCHAYLASQPGDPFFQNVRLFQQKDLTLSKIQRAINMDPRTIKKYLWDLEQKQLIIYTGDCDKEATSFNEKWKLRQKDPASYYQIPVTKNMLFRKIPAETLRELNELYQVNELTLKVYMTLVNYQEDCIVNGKTQRGFTYEDLRSILGYKKGTNTNRHIEASLHLLEGIGLIEYEEGIIKNRKGLNIPAFILKQANFYIEYKKKGFEPAEETVIPEEERAEIIEKNRGLYPEAFK